VAPPLQNSQSMSWAIWITGPPGSGKTTLARGVAAALEARGITLKVLELDEIRKVVTPAPTYSEIERDVRDAADHEYGDLG